MKTANQSLSKQVEKLQALLVKKETLLKKSGLVLKEKEFESEIADRLNTGELSFYLNTSYPAINLNRALLLLFLLLF